jgi:hypothetical protein
VKDHIPPVPPHNPSEEPGLVSEEMKHLAYGEASLMLIECLMLALIERGVLTTHEVIGAVEAAVATKRQMVDDGDQAQIASVAAGVLSTLANSLRAAKA